MKRLYAGLAAATMFAGLAGMAQGAETIRMLAPTWLGFAPVHVANDLGCFKEEGLEVDYKFEDDRTNVLAAYARGDIEVDMRTVGEHQGRPRDAETPGVIIGTIDESLGGDGVITDETVKSVSDLKGKTIAAEPNIPARLLLQMELKKAGLGLGDLQIKDIATADTAAVFADTSIAAIATYEPFMSQAVKASTRPGARVFVSSKDYPGIIIDIITARKEDLAANPKKYQSFLKCIYKAIDYSKAEPDKYAELAPGVGFSATMLLKDTAHRTVFPVWSAGGGFGLEAFEGAGDVVMLPSGRAMFLGYGHRSRRETAAWLERHAGVPVVPGVTPAELVVLNGQVLTVDARSTRAEAVAIRDGVIVFVGSDRDARAFVGEKTRVLDAGGKSVVPGLIDTHVHIDSHFGPDGRASNQGETPAQRAYAAASNAWVTLMAGYTTVQSIGSPSDSALGAVIANNDAANPDDYFTKYNGLLLTFNKRWSDRWQAVMSYTLSKAEGLITSSCVGPTSPGGVSQTTAAFAGSRSR